MRETSKRRLLLLGALCLAAPPLSACSGDAPPPEPALRPVRAHRAAVSAKGEARTYSGSSKASSEARLSFRVRGTVRRLAVKAGESVRKGQVLAELDTRDLELQLGQAQAGLAQARAQLRNADAAFARVRELYAARSASKSDYDAARAGSESARAATRVAGKQVEQARQQTAYAKLVAPSDGVVVGLSCEENEHVNPGQPVVVLASGEAVHVQFGVPEMDIAQIRAGGKAKVRFAALPGRTFAGTLVEVGVSASASATYPVTLRLDQSDPALRSGMAAEVEIPRPPSAGPPTLRVPAVAVGEDRSGRFLFVVAPEPGQPSVGIVGRRAVKVGELTPEGIEILEGLQAGEVVVTAGLSFLEDGRKVRMPTLEPEGLQPQPAAKPAQP